MKLKFMIAAFASCLLSLQASMAQVPTVWDNCSERGIKTNPKAPVNLHDTTKVNTFNWLLKEFPVNGVLISQIESPFFQPDNTETYPLRISQDQASGGGWELIKQGLGFVSLGVPGLNKIKRPYYILYNKYTAIMRVFFAGSTDLRSDTDFTAAQILLSFAPTSYQSSALMLANAPVAILDNFTKNQEMVSGTAFNNDLAKWVYADFPMTYDPCACNFKSALYAELKLVRTAQINMLGLSQGTLMSISNGQGSVNQKASKWTLQNAIGAGKKAYVQPICRS